MPLRKKIVGALLCGAIAIAAILAVFLVRGSSAPADLASYLPDKGGTLLYIDVDGMRKTGFLNMLAGAKAAEELEYKEFVTETGFDYRHDLEAIAATFRSDQIFVTLRGRFDWDKLIAYGKKHGGSCHGDYCAVPGSQPQRRISYSKLGRNLMALAISTDDMAAYQIVRNASKVSPFTPDAPVWVMVPAQVLKETASFPAGIRSFAMAIQNSERAIFSIAPEGDRLKVSLLVASPSVDTASALLVQLESTTNMLRKMLSREHQVPNPADLSGVLASGTFRRDDRNVLGEWPIQRVFVDSIAGGSH